MVLEKRGLAGARPELGRFRSYLKTAFRHYLLNEAERDRAEKRGGKVQIVSSVERVDVAAGWSFDVMDLHEALVPFSTGGVYVNTLGTAEEDRVPAAYGENYPRLSELKRKWDPENLFRTNHNIEPGGE